MNDAPRDTQGLAAILQREYAQADSYYDQLERLQRAAFEYYEAQPFGNEVEGRSQIVLPDVQETIDYMQASVLRTFLSGDRTVEFEATDEPETDEQGNVIVDHAEDATAAINYSFMRQQDGARILHDALGDGLLKKIGVFKTCVETEEKVGREQVVGTEDQLAFLPEGVEVETYDDNGDGTVTAHIKRTRIYKCYRDYAVPVAEFRFSPLARHEDTADYLCHVSEKTRSDLVEMGFDADQAYALPGYNSFQNNRVESDELDQFISDESSRALEKVQLCEEYARIDIDGDGIAERVKVFRVENEILIDAKTGEPSIETVDDQPFSVFCPFPRPHRLVGYSLADKVMDIQLGRSFLARQLFDGMAFANMPRLVVDTQAATVDTYNDILTPIPGSPVRIKGGVAGVQPLQTNFDVGKSLTAMEWFTGERESRTGITRLNQGLDADALNKTATGTALMQAQGQQQEEFVARQFAEALSRLFVKKYRLMRSEAGEPIRVKVDGQYRTIDPSQWPEDINVVVRVGLGSNSKDKRIQYRMALAPLLAESVQAGTSGADHVFKMWDGLARDMGIGQGDDYAFDPVKGEGGDAANKPDDPEMAKVESEHQLRAAKLHGEQEAQAFKLQAMREEAAERQQLQRDQADHDAALAEAKAQREADLAERKFAFEASQAERRAALEERLAMHKATLAREANDAKISENRPGGDLSK